MSPTAAEIAATAKAAHWATKKAAELVAAYRARKIAFAQDPEVVRVIKDTRRKAEFKTFGRFASGRQRVLLQLGLALRAIADQPAKVQTLRQGIMDNFRLEGLHFAQAVQHGAFTLIYQTFLDAGLTEPAFETQMKDVLGDIDKFVFFVQEDMDPRKEAPALLARLRRDSPDVFVIAALGRARDTAAKVMKELRYAALGYTVTTRSADWTDSYVLTPAACRQVPAVRPGSRSVRWRTDSRQTTT